MPRTGIVAGAGSLPLDFVLSARAKGRDVIVFALEGAADRRLEEAAKGKVYWLKITQYKKLLFLLVIKGVRELVLLGKFEKSALYEKGRTLKQYSRKLGRLPDRKDYSILKEITRVLAFVGVKVTDGLEYLSHLVPTEGVLTATRPDKRVSDDISFGYDTAKKLAGMDIGQTVVIKDRSVVAVEAMEGTDAVIDRAFSIAGAGCVMVKVSRPGQDMRWDVPVVGPETIKKLSAGKFSALAVESGKMFVVDKEEVIKLADSVGMTVQVLV